MPEREAAPSTPPQTRTLSQALKQAAFFALFSVMLMIPRLRRLRRRPRIWTGIRVVAAAAGAWLVWRHIAGDATGPQLALGIALVLFAVLIRAKPVKRTVDDLAPVVGALVVLNGGRFGKSEGEPSENTKVLAASDRLYVLDARDTIIAEIPVSAIRHLTASPAGKNFAAEGGPWDVEVHWDDGARERTARFHYEGFFAAHLARVMETTLRNLMRKELTVLK